MFPLYSKLSHISPERPLRSWKDPSGSFTITSLMVHSERIFIGMYFVMAYSFFLRKGQIITIVAVKVGNYLSTLVAVLVHIYILATVFLYCLFRYIKNI